VYESLEVFRLANAMAVHAGKRQALIAQNMANADTPGYVARDLVPFKEVIQPNTSGLQKATRATHLHGAAAQTARAQSIEERMHASIDDNTVSVENQMLKAVETKRHHDRALAIYRSSLQVLRSALGRQ
jgi:flagellar basal-body rod protein FlgB